MGDYVKSGAFFKQKKVIAWALYDWANSAFATTVMAGFFPLFYKQYWAIGVDSTVGTFHLGMANAFASVCIMLSAPLLGTMADCVRRPKIFLAVFAALGIGSCVLFSVIGEGAWLLAISAYVIATIGFMGANIFYDALITTVAGQDEINLVSTFGYALGYLGGGILFAFNVSLVLAPELFGLADSAMAIKLSFLSVAVWWAVFSIPLFLWVPNSVADHGAQWKHLVSRSFKQMLTTLHRLKQYRAVGLFLLAYWLYIDGVDTIVRMAVDYGQSLGLDHQHLIAALLVTQLVGFPATLLFGLLGQRVGAKQGILVGLVVYGLVVIWAFYMTQVWEFYGLAILVGLVQGGVQGLSRSYYAGLIPVEWSAEFFGFYNMMGKAAAVIGPLLIGFVTLTTHSHRAGMLSILILFLLGGMLLWRVDEK